MRIAFRVYFKSISVRKAGTVPESGPLLIVSNHPSTFMDPMVIGLQMKQPLFFLAKAEVFRSGFAKWLLPKFNMIPVYRKQDDPSQMHKNDETFEKCYEHLANKGTILIFPEGVSITQRKLEKIKTGAARIALGAEAAHGYSLGVKILTVGLNYSNPHRFQSDLFINLDEPITVADFKTLHQVDSIKAAQALTEKIRGRLEHNIITIEDSETDKLVKNIELVFQSRLQQLSAENEQPAGPSDQFEMTKKIVQAVQYFNLRDPDRVQRMTDKTDMYFTWLERMHLNDHLLKNLSRSGSIFFRSLSRLLYLFFGFPVWLFGVINNYLPYKLPYYIARSLTKKVDWHGALFVTSGIFTFIAFYSIQIWLVQDRWHDWRVTLAYFLLLPLTGFFAFAYYRRFTDLRGKWLIFSLFAKRATLVSRLLNMRQEIIDEIEQGRKEFLVGS